MPWLFPARFTLQLIRLLQNADVEAEEFARQELLNDFVVIEEWLALKPDPTFHFTVFAFWRLPILHHQKNQNELKVCKDCGNLGLMTYEFKASERDADQIQCVVWAALKTETVEDSEALIL